MTATKKATRFDRFWRRIGKFSVAEWLGVAFWVVAIWLFIKDPLDLYENGKWWIYLVALFVVILVVSWIGNLMLFLGKLVVLVEVAYEKLRRNELRMLYEQNPKTLKYGVELRGKWKDLYDMIGFTGADQFEGTETKIEAGEGVEYPVMKWRLSDDHVKPDWDFIEVPSTEATILRGLIVLIVVVATLGVILNAIAT